MARRLRVSNAPIHYGTQTTFIVYSGTTSDPWRKTTDTVNYHGCDAVNSREMMDFVTPNYRKIVSSGGIINNPMSRTVSKEVYTGGTYHARFIAYSTTNPVYYTGWEADGSWFGSIAGKTNQYIALPSLNETSLRERAVVEAFSRNKGNDTMLLATIGELKETVTSIEKALKDVIKITRYIWKCNLKALRKEITSKQLANRWMEARYALRPLVYDVSQTLAAFNQKEVSKRITARSTVTSDSTQSDEVLIHSDSYSQIYAARATTLHIECRAGVMSCIENLTKLNIWGVDQLMSSAWELVPLSFVVDWFFNVGKLVAAWEPTLGLKALASWVTVTRTATQICEVSRTPVIWNEPRQYAAGISHYCKSVKTFYRQDRSPNPSLPLYPQFNVRLDGYKLLDLGIILKNIMS